LFNLDPHVVAVAKKMLSHLLNRRGWVPQHGLFSKQAIRRTSGSLLWPQKLRQLGDIGRDPPRLVARGQAPNPLRAVFNGPFLVSA
jgi:hypothetical protein